MLKRIFADDVDEGVDDDEPIVFDGRPVMYVKQHMFICTMHRAKMGLCGRHEYLICRLCGGNGNNVEIEALPTAMRVDEYDQIVRLCTCEDWDDLVRAL